MRFKLKCAGMLACIPASYVQAQQIPDSIFSQSLQEIVVTGQSARQRITEGRLGSENLEPPKLALTPQMFGETDIIKSITLMPGIRGGAEGTGGWQCLPEPCLNGRNDALQPVAPDGDILNIQR